MRGHEMLQHRTAIIEAMPQHEVVEEISQLSLIAHRDLAEPLMKRLPHRTAETGRLHKRQQIALQIPATLYQMLIGCHAHAPCHTTWLQDTATPPTGPLHAAAIRPGRPHVCQTAGSNTPRPRWP